MFRSYQSLKLTVVNPFSLLTFVINPSNTPPPPLNILLVLPRYFAAFSNFLLETFVIYAKFDTPNLPKSPNIGKTQMEAFWISGFLVNPLQTKSVITRTSNDLT